METIATLGTYATPTAGFVRFKEVDATNMPGLYELQWVDARYAVASAKYLDICITGVADLATFTGRVYLDVMDATGVRAAIGLATANLDTQIADLPTNAELAARSLLAAEYATATASTSIAGQLTDFQDGTATMKTIDDVVDAILADTADMQPRVAAIETDTNELQVDWVNGGRLDLLLDATKAVTDAITFTVAGKVDANITHVIADPVIASSAKATNWGGTP